MTGSRNTSSRVVMFCIALILAGTSTLQAQLRKGMTWSYIEQNAGAVHVGADGQTNPYLGDTTVDQYRPLLCLQVDGQAPPAGMTFDFYNGWAQGTLQATPAIQGTTLSSQSRGNAICAETFGVGYKMAEFHDGHYGDNFTSSGGWSYWGNGTLIAGSRFWVAIGDQPANPWNSAGDPLPPDDDAVIKTRLTELVNPVLNFARDARFRELVFSDIRRRFDGDDDVLLSDIIRDAEQAQIVDPNSPEWRSFVAQVAAFQNVNGTAYDPQIYIPNFEDGPPHEDIVTMVVYETDLSKTVVQGVQVDSSGNRANLLIDEAYTETHEVWVLAINERVGMDPGDLAVVRELDAMGATSRKAHPSLLGIPREVNTPPACNPTGLRNNNGAEYLRRFKIPNPASVEHWTAGKVEPRAIVIGKGGVEIGNKYFGKIKRNTVKDWVYKDDVLLTPWDRALYGDNWVFKWIEEDGGPKLEISLGLGAWIKQLLNIPVTLDIKATFEKHFDDMGTGIVNFNDSTYTDYGTGTVSWTECSVGGDGGTGHDNLARTAIAAASSTYPGYSVTRVNDGSQSTALGGGSSWANAANTAMPQWVQLDFGTVKTFSQVVLFTTASYPMRDYDIQVWNSTLGVWQTVASVRGNTAASVTTNFTPRTSRLIRILCLSGPVFQPGYTRINEFEVYP